MVGALLVSICLIAAACVTATGDDPAELQATALPGAPGASATEAAPIARAEDDAADVEPEASAGPRVALLADEAARDASSDVDEATDDVLRQADTPAPELAAADAAADPGVRTEPAIGYLSLDASQAFVQTISDGLREAAAAAGIDLVECDAGWTRQGVRACASELAREGVSGVISMQPFPDLNEEVCATLDDRPTIGIVYDQGPCQVSLLEIDQVESGRLAGSALGALAADRFACEVKAFVSLESGANDPIGGARMAGYREGYREHCELPERDITLNDAQHLVTARTQFAGVLDDIKGKPIMVAGVTEDAILGAMSAAAKRDRSNHLWLSGQLADPVIRQTIACDDHYVASVAQFPARFGDTVVPAMIDAIDGAEVPPRLTAELELVTARNVRDLFPDTPACDG